MHTHNTVHNTISVYIHVTMLTVIIAVSSGAGSYEEDDYMKFLMENLKAQHFLVKGFTERKAKHYVELHSASPFDSIEILVGLTHCYYPLFVQVMIFMCIKLKCLKRHKIFNY